MTAADRLRRTQSADTLCRTAYEDLGGPDAGVALVAVGGYGRGELAAPDLDLVLLHADEVDRFDITAFAEKIWYPLWDGDMRLDHSVRSELGALVAALLHDIGKGSLTEHSVAGMPIADAVARRWGFDDCDAQVIARLVRWHLLLGEQATTRDPDDPATASFVMARLGSVEALDLLEMLTEADAKAASAKAWTTWRARLVHQLAAACRRNGTEADAEPVAAASGVVGESGLAGDTGPTSFGIPRAVRKHPSVPSFEVEPADAGSRVRVIAGDRIGLLADIAATFAMQRVAIHAARAWTQDAFAISQWDLADDWLDPAVLRQRFSAIAEGRLDVGRKLRRGGLDPTVATRPEASRSATVLEVRAADRTGADSQVLARRVVTTYPPSRLATGAATTGEEVSARPVRLEARLTVL